jgi:hypothetical protein
MKCFGKFFSNRTHVVFRFSGVLGLLLGWATMYWFDNWHHPFFWILISIAVVLGYGGAWGGLAEQWGMSPLRKDPLGWRKAKKSYQPQSPESSSEDQAPKP